MLGEIPSGITKYNKNMSIDEILNELTICLKASNPYKIILFGSYANGEATEDSDID
jgi:predicted nucleotidyltransferase